MNNHQNAKISQNFRVTKALHACKRPFVVSGHDSTPCKVIVSEFDQRNSENLSIRTIGNENAKNLGQPYRVSRPLLSEIQTNTWDSRPSNGGHPFRFEHIESFPGGNPTSEMNSPAKIRTEIVRDCISTTLATPMVPSVRHSVDDTLSPVSFFDEEFDDSILKEIDALCEQQSTMKKERRRFSHSNLSGQIMVSSQNSVNTSVISCNLGASVKFQADESIVKSLHNGLSTMHDRGEHASISADVQDNSRSPNQSDVKRNVESFSNHSMTSTVVNHDDSTNPSLSLGEGSATDAQAYSEYLKSLNDMQKEAATSDIERPLLILAGPGSGKTSTMVARILTLLKEGIGSSNILATTFTTAAASEMRERIGSVAGKPVAKELTICTFHSFGLQLCRSHAEKLGRTSEFLLYGPGQQRRAVIEAVRLMEVDKMTSRDVVVHKVGEDSKSGTLGSCKDKSKKWQKFVTQAKASGRTAEEYRKMGDISSGTILVLYEDILRSCNALDYHDLISSSVKLLTEFPGVYKECQETWKAIVVDEFQDTSAMQYNLLRILSSHNRITVVGDDDQSIFSFNGADTSGFDSFRRDFPTLKEVRLQKNYRSTRSIVEAASSLIRNNLKRCQFKEAVTDNSSGCKITIKECLNEDAQCAFVADKITEMISDNSSDPCSFGSIAILYRRQVSGKAFQACFRTRKIPFNVHGVAFYRKKVIKAVTAMLRTALPGCDDGPFRQVFKALYPGQKEEKKRIIDYIDKISTSRKCSFLSSASDAFNAKISGIFSRSQLAQGRKVLFALDMISKLVGKEQSLSTVLTSVANLLPQRYLFEQRAVIDTDGSKLLNEDHDLRSVLQYLLDDVSDFLSTHGTITKSLQDGLPILHGCGPLLKAFLDYISSREAENFRSRRSDNENSVSLTTIHQSKGLEWDTVFIIKANETEIPLLNESCGVLRDGANSLEEERRLLYVAMTRARKKLCILYVLMDMNQQLLQPSRFLKEFPEHLLEIQVESSWGRMHPCSIPKCAAKNESLNCEESLPTDLEKNKCSTLGNELILINTNNEIEGCLGNSFLRRFKVEDRSTVSNVFHSWAKKQAFQDPRRLLDKVGFVIDERLRSKACKSKDALRSLKSSLRCDEALQFAQYVLRWEQIPPDTRAQLMREKQEHFQKQRIEKSMDASAASTKQIAYLQKLGCTILPTSRLHASRLIEQYKSL
ncbi:ATP-dependent DNA helicase SRS2-like protein At4g25120 isoform X1 [Amborella trichopoda]|uniref:ATP-dependent DNA helicase SRS2-like protein At4g25120 isoform X1 n=2 Tax=Amborella trichopoda TaxID=13333 RepID=UPI0009BDC038|nr:ATP-dependent DNA helicase SRS2-like protein At4g25120 isoform X1 [Amborella trichopoda]|eukprot:XP_020519936.1 ATP-dependent DNA helicase SRS2-like protein At4g25120 isoform X1 [Amborella trichopoda]